MGHVYVHRLICAIQRIEHMEQIFYTINYNSGSSPPQVASPSQTDVQVPARTHSAAAEDRIGVPPAVILSSNETYFKAVSFAFNLSS